MLGTKKVVSEQTVKTDAYTAAARLAFSLNYLIRNATRGDGELHGAADEFAETLCEFVDYVIAEVTEQRESQLRQ